MQITRHASQQTLLLITMLFLNIPVQSAVVCDQLTQLAPGIMRFLAHSNGSLLAAQEAVQSSKTCLSFFTFQKSTPEGRPAKLIPLSQLSSENGQGIVWDWAKTKPYFVFGTPQGKIAAYAIPEEAIEDIPTTPLLLGSKTKHSEIKAIAWSSEGEHFASIAGDKLTIYSLDLESKKHPIKRATSIVLPIENITFLQWSHDDAFIVAGNSEELLFWRTRTTSGNLKLSAYSPKELENALKCISGEIKDIAWNRTSTPTLAILNNKLTLITLQAQGSQSPIVMLHNFASRTSSVLSWNAGRKTCQPGAQELIVSEITGRTYQVYTMTDKSLMFNTTTRDLLPPFNRGVPQGQTRSQSAPAQKHDLSETTMLELVNKLANKPIISLP